MTFDIGSPLALPPVENVVFSHDIFSAQSTGGISRCMIEVMAALGGDSWTLWAGGYHNRLLAAALTDADFAGRVVAARPVATARRWPLALRNEARFGRFAQAHRVGLVHRTYYPVIDLVRGRRGVRQVHTVHDMWDERAPSAGAALRLRSAVKLRALAMADAIVCVSESTRTELLALRPHLAGRAVVIHHGVRRLSDRPDFRADRPFFLFVGQRGSYKNFDIAVAALAHAGLPDHDLVCFGGGPFTAAERELLDAAGMTARVRQCRGSDDVLAGAYEAATALLYPSSYEGFGLPLLEAMIHGCVVVAAPLTALPEIGGDAALYAAAREPDAWAAALRQLVGNDELTARLRDRGRSRAAGFTWQRSAAAHRAVYAGLG